MNMRRQNWKINLHIELTLDIFSSLCGTDCRMPFRLILQGFTRNCTAGVPLYYWKTFISVALQVSFWFCFKNMLCEIFALDAPKSCTVYFSSYAYMTKLWFFMLREIIHDFWPSKYRFSYTYLIRCCWIWRAQLFFSKEVCAISTFVDTVQCGIM